MTVAAGRLGACVLGSSQTWRGFGRRLLPAVPRLGRRVVAFGLAAIALRGGRRDWPGVIRRVAGVTRRPWRGRLRRSGGDVWEDVGRGCGVRAQRRNLTTNAHIAHTPDITNSPENAGKVRQGCQSMVGIWLKGVAKQMDSRGWRRGHRNFAGELRRLARQSMRRAASFGPWRLSRSDVAGTGLWRRQVGRAVELQNDAARRFEQQRARRRRCRCFSAPDGREACQVPEEKGCGDASGDAPGHRDRHIVLGELQRACTQPSDYRPRRTSRPAAIVTAENLPLLSHTVQHRAFPLFPQPRKASVNARNSGGGVIAGQARGRRTSVDERGLCALSTAAIRRSP